MRLTDVSESPRIAVTLALLNDMAGAESPRDMLSRFGNQIRKIRKWEALVSISRRGLGPGEYKVTRNLRPADHDPERDQAMDPWGNWEKIPASTGGFIGRVIQDPSPKLIQDLEIRGDPALGDSVADMRSCIAIPRVERGDPIYWTFFFNPNNDHFSLEILEEALLTTNLVGAMTSQLAAISTIKELNSRLQRQFEEVARVQQSLLPTRLPDIPGVRMAASYLTSEQAGGDYYDFFPLEGGRWGFLIADVAGHGAAAATIMAMLHAILHSYPGEPGNPEQVMAYANEKLCRANIDGSFVTAFFGVYDPGTHLFRYARAGHNPPRLKRGDTGEIVSLDGAAAVPLGVIPRAELTSETVELAPLDTVVLYTDGITEEFNASGEMFGVAGLDAALLECSGEPECVVDSIHSALYRHTGRRTRADDQTLVSLRRVDNIPKGKASLVSIGDV